MIRHLTWPAALFASACAAPDAGELYVDVDVQVPARGLDVEDAFIDAIAEARSSLHVALSDTDNDELLAALVDRYAEVRDRDDFVFELIVDYDDRGAGGIQALIEAGAPVTLADDGLTYFEFLLNENVTWSSEQTIMSHAYVVVDERSIVAATSAGHRRRGPRLQVSMHGEDLVEDWLIEHNQIFGGTDAVATTAFDAPAKSIADMRWWYGTTRAQSAEVWFGPQERLTKRVIDTVYGARSAIWVMTNDLANDGLVAALEEKASWGFDVKVVVGAGFGERFGGATAELADELRQASGFDVVQVPDDIAELPTLVLVDLPPDEEGFAPDARAMVLTHDLLSSARLYDERVVVTDQLIDGAMWVLVDRTETRDDLTRLRDLFDDTFATGAPL